MQFEFYEKHRVTNVVHRKRPPVIASGLYYSLDRAPGEFTHQFTVLAHFLDKYATFVYFISENENNKRRTAGISLPRAKWWRLKLTPFTQAPKPQVVTAQLSCNFV